MGPLCTDIDLAYRDMLLTLITLTSRLLLDPQIWYQPKDNIDDTITHIKYELAPRDW